MSIPSRRGIPTAYIIRTAAGVDAAAGEREVAAAVARLALGEQRVSERLSVADTEVAVRCGALLRLANAVVTCGGGRVRDADTLATPLRIHCGLRRPLPGSLARRLPPTSAAPSSCADRRPHRPPPRPALTAAHTGLR